jgi:hypothetical protein
MGSSVAASHEGRRALPGRGGPDHGAEHAGLHVIEEVTVKRPLAGRIGADEKTYALPAFDVDVVLVGPNSPLPFSNSLHR